MDLITSGAFQTRTRLSAKALRLYGEQGILEPVHVDPINRYRYYDGSQIEQARLIVMLRELDIPLAKIRDVMRMTEQQRIDVVAAHRRDLDAKHSAQQHLAAYVISVISNERKPIMSVSIRNSEESTYLTEKKRLSPQEIPGFIQESCGRIAVVAESFGGWAGPLTTIYQSPVNDDTDGEVENAIPVRAGVRAEDVPPTINVLVEPAGEVAFTRITKSQVRYPQILQAYDEVYCWLGQQGLTPALAPREILFADFDSAGPDDEVCDIAVPFTR